MITIKPNGLLLKALNLKNITKQLVFLLVVVGIMLMSTLASVAQAKQFKVLLFTKTDGWHHKSIHEGVGALRKMADAHFFDLEWHEDASRINDDNLKQFDAIIFLLTTGNVLNDAQQAAMEKFIQSGNGYVGVHSAADTEYKWPWYQQLVGRHFIIHPTIQTAKLTVENRSFPGLSTLPDEQLWTDEWYQYSAPQVDDLQYLLSIDEQSYDAKADWGHVKGEGMGNFHPVAWYHHYDGGRSFYTGLGHVAANYESPMFLAHLYGGIYWAATGKGMAEQ